VTLPLWPLFRSLWPFFGLPAAAGLTAPIPPSQSTELEIPSALEQIILSCLEKKPEKRPQTALELAERLAACEIREPWTREDAQRWWALNKPVEERAEAHS